MKNKPMLQSGSKIEASSGWKKCYLGLSSCRPNIKSLEHLLQGRCSLQLLVGTFGRGRVVAASTFAHAVSAPAHGWSWRLFLGIGSKRWWNWNARLRFQFSRYLEQELRKLGALDLSTSNQLSHSLFHCSWRMKMQQNSLEPEIHGQTLLEAASVLVPVYCEPMGKMMSIPWHGLWEARLASIPKSAGNVNSQQHQLGVEEWREVILKSTTYRPTVTATQSRSFWLGSLLSGCSDECSCSAISFNILKVPGSFGSFFSPWQLGRLLIFCQGLDSKILGSSLFTKMGTTNPWTDWCYWTILNLLPFPTWII